MEQAIRKAIEGGYDKRSLDAWQSGGLEQIGCGLIVLDPSFWQCLGKALGWSKSCWHLAEDGHVPFRHPAACGNGMHSWQLHWHRFIDHLAEGKDAESFFAELLK